MASSSQGSLTAFALLSDSEERGRYAQGHDDR